jgi:hypothetical protein
MSVVVGWLARKWKWEDEGSPVVGKANAKENKEKGKGKDPSLFGFPIVNHTSMASMKRLLRIRRGPLINRRQRR